MLWTGNNLKDSGKKNPISSESLKSETEGTISGSWRFFLSFATAGIYLRISIMSCKGWRRGWWLNSHRSTRLPTNPTLWRNSKITQDNQTRLFSFVSFSLNNRKCSQKSTDGFFLFSNSSSVSTWTGTKEGWGWYHTRSCPRPLLQIYQSTV